MSGTVYIVIAAMMSIGNPDGDVGNRSQALNNLEDLYVPTQDKYRSKTSCVASLLGSMVESIYQQSAGKYGIKTELKTTFTTVQKSRSGGKLDEMNVAYDRSYQGKALVFEMEDMEDFAWTITYNLKQGLLDFYYPHLAEVSDRDGHGWYKYVCVPLTD